MPRYFLGVDNGGTVSKATLFTDKGIEVSSHAESVRMITPRSGFTERDMEELWQVTARVIARTIAKAGIDSSLIQGVACTGHGKGLYLWGKDGKPCGNGIISTDTRAWEYPKRWQEDGTADRVFAKTFQSILACQPVSLLNWMMDHEPSRLEQVRWIFEVKDYIRFRLTGTPAAEITDYSGSNLLNCATGSFDSELLNEFGLGHLFEALPPLKKSTDICGEISSGAAELTGLTKGTPVAGGMFDIDACAIAMDITNENNVAVIAGTWSINEYISRTPVLDRSVMMNSLYCMDGYYLIEESSPTSASNHAWFIEMFLAKEQAEAARLGVHPYGYCDSLAEQVAPDAQHIVFLPYLYGSNYNPQAKAALIGVDSHHTRAHMIRAVLEGIAFGHKIHLDRLLANRDHTDSIRLAGGVTASPLWTQIFCDVFGLPVETIDTQELGTLGCAMAASVASGTYANLAEAASQMVRVGNTVFPDPVNNAIYAQKFELFSHISSTLDSSWKKFP